MPSKPVTKGAERERILICKDNPIYAFVRRAVTYAADDDSGSQATQDSVAPTNLPEGISLMKR